MIPDHCVMYILSHALNERQDTNLINMDISRNLLLLLYIFIVLIFLQLKVSYRLHRSLSFPNFPTGVFNMLISLIYINNSNTNFCDACFFSARRHLFLQIFDENKNIIRLFLLLLQMCSPL